MNTTERLVKAAIAASVLLSGCVPPQHTGDAKSTPTPGQGSFSSGGGHYGGYGGGSRTESDDDEDGHESAGRGGFGSAGADAGGD